MNAPKTINTATIVAEMPVIEPYIPMPFNRYIVSTISLNAMSR